MSVAVAAVIINTPALLRAEIITLQLRQPRQFNQRVTGLPAIEKPQNVSGVVTFCVNPGLLYSEPERYQVDYFMNGILVKSITGAEVAARPESFEYELDTTECDNGRYRLTVQVLDNKGNPSSGTCEIIISNERGSP